MKLFLSAAFLCVTVGFGQLQANQKIVQSGSQHSQLVYYLCELCHASFPNKSTLSRHQKDHKGLILLTAGSFDSTNSVAIKNRQTVCSYCGEKYSNQSGLIVHMKKFHHHLFNNKPGGVCQKSVQELPVLESVEQSLPSESDQIRSELLQLEYFYRQLELKNRCAEMKKCSERSEILQKMIENW